MGKYDRIKTLPKQQGAKVKANTEAIAKRSTLHEKGLLSFELFESGRQCASTWEKDQVRLLLECFRKISERTWEEIFRSGGKSGNKVGLGYTLFEDSTCPVQRHPKLADDIRMSEIRVSQEARIFGAHVHGTYYVIELDKGHDRT